MEQKKENEWTKYICELLKKELDMNKYEITCLERVPYRANIVGFDDNRKEIIEYMKYQTDLLIKEIVNNNSIPRLIIESKFGGITSHDAITYSNKAQSHKEIYNGLRYGIIIAKVNKVPTRLIQHGNNFDFMFSFSSENPNSKEWNLFVEIIKKNLKIAKIYDEVMNERRKKNNSNFNCIERDCIFHLKDN